MPRSERSDLSIAKMRWKMLAKVVIFSLFPIFIIIIVSTSYVCKKMSCALAEITVLYNLHKHPYF